MKRIGFDLNPQFQSMNDGKQRRPRIAIGRPTTKTYMEALEAASMDETVYFENIQRVPEETTAPKDGDAITLTYVFRKEGWYPTEVTKCP